MLFYLNSGLVVSRYLDEFLHINSGNFVCEQILRHGRTNAFNFLDVHVEDGEPKISYLETKKFLGLFGNSIPSEKAYSEEFEKKRVIIKPGRLVSKILDSNEFSNSDLEEFVDLFKAHFGLQLDYRVVKGEDVRKYYLAKNYQYETGSLGGSCMKYKKCQDYLDIYVDNAKLLVGIFPNTEKIALRALLWDGVKVEDGYKAKKINFMDRIYSNSERFVPQAKKWAMENGYFHKKYQCYSDAKIVIDTDGNPHEIEMSLDIKLKNYEYYPFLDTFAYGYKKKITNFEDEGKDYIILRETDGTFS